MESSTANDAVNWHTVPDSSCIIGEKRPATPARDDLLGRWRAAACNVRSWALENPHLYALVYGWPVPGYVAP